MKRAPGILAGPPAGCDARRRAGLTLLELLVVMMIVSVLLGLGVGFLQRGSSDLDAAAAMLRDRLRLAARTAKLEGLPTMLTLQPGPGGGAVRVQVRGLREVGSWHLEPGERWWNAQIRPVLTGRDEPRGRFGHGMRPLPGAKEPLLAVAAGRRDAFDLDEGFSFRLDLRLDRAAPAVVGRLGSAFELSLDGGGRVLGRVTLGLPGPRRGPLVVLRGRRPLPVGEWVTLELVHDGERAMLLVDGRLEAQAPARGVPFRQADDALEVSPPGEPVPGTVDEIRLLAYEQGEWTALPDDVVLVGLQGPIRFRRDGEPEIHPTFEIVLGEQRQRHRIGPGGILE